MERPAIFLRSPKASTYKQARLCGDRAMTNMPEAKARPPKPSSAMRLLAHGDGISILLGIPTTTPVTVADIIKVADGQLPRRAKRLVGRALGATNFPREHETVPDRLRPLPSTLPSFTAPGKKHAIQP